MSSLIFSKKEKGIFLKVSSAVVVICGWVGGWGRFSINSSVFDVGHFHSTITKWLMSKIKNRLSSSAGPDEMAHYEPSHLDLHCLHRYQL